MDQLKEFLRQAVKHRFWIAVVVSALLPLIAYFTASGAIKEEAQKAEAEIKTAHADVGKYRSPGLPNAQYKPIADQKVDALTRDVNTAWRQLYERQAPLLTWPAPVQEYFRSWGRKWPEDVSPNRVQDVIIEYVNLYPGEVDRVYNSFSPWKALDITEIAPDYAEISKTDPQKVEELRKKAEAGTGLVAAPPKEVLLKPSTFTTTEPPTLGKVWEAQEKLWVQGALLDVIAKVNAKANAKDWESAPIKQITLLELGSELAQDQQSLAKGETLVEPEELVQAGTEAAAVVDESASTGMESAYGSGMESAYGASMGGSGMGAAPSDRVRFIQPEGGQYRVYPVSLSVLIDQNYIQDLLVEFENSPMAIQVKEFDMQRPKTRVTKPQAGQTLGFSPMGAYASSMSGGYGSSPYSSMMQGSTMESGMMAPGMMNPYGASAYMGGGMGMSPTGPVSKGKDIRDLTKARTKKDSQAKEKTAPPKVQIYDPYYNIVEVRIYGQARFYNPPPPVEEPAPTSEGVTAAVEAPADPGAPQPTPAAEPATPQPAAEPVVSQPAEPAPATPEATKAAGPPAEPAPTDKAPSPQPEADTAAPKR